MYQLSREISSDNRCHAALDQFMTSMQLYSTPMSVAHYIGGHTNKIDDICTSGSRMGTEMRCNPLPLSISHFGLGPLSVVRFRGAVAAMICRRENNIYVSSLLSCSQMCKGDVEALSKASLAQRVCFYLSDVTTS